MICEKDIRQIALKNNFFLDKFSDFSDFFSSWSVSFSKGGTNYLIECDGRDGWLFYYSKNATGGLCEIDKLVSHTFNKDDFLNQIDLWTSKI